MDLFRFPPPEAFLRPSVGKNGKQNVADFSVEDRLRRAGFDKVCGVDEAGRGPLAGPVVCACVVLDPDNLPPGLNDSKQVSPATRRNLYNRICREHAVSIATASPTTIDRLNIRSATLAAMTKAISALPAPVDAALIDGNALPPPPVQAPSLPMWAMIKGDGRSASIAAASIVAKTVRDELMAQADLRWPEYGFRRHMGYPTVQHRNILARIGPCPIHRKSFAPVKAALKNLART
ncbi:MAG: ribonuclease HII [Pseudomonadota bacterium]